MDYLKSLNIEQNEYSSSSGSTWFILVEQNSKVPVSRIVLNNQGPTFIYMTSKQMKKSFDRDIFICPHLQLIFNLSLTCDDKTVPLALYALQDGPDVKS